MAAPHQELSSSSGQKYGGFSRILAGLFYRPVSGRLILGLGRVYWVVLVRQRVKLAIFVRRATFGGVLWRRRPELREFRRQAEVV
jgi:hypothetical protein